MDDTLKLKQAVHRALEPYFRRRGWTAGSVVTPLRSGNGTEPAGVLLGRDGDGNATAFLLWRVETRDPRDVRYLARRTRDWDPSTALDIGGVEHVCGLVIMENWTPALRETAEDAGLAPVTPFDIEFDLIDSVFPPRRLGVGA